MSKTTATPAQSEPKQPAYVAELLKNGTVVLEAKSRDELTAMVSDIPAATHYCAGAAGRNKETGVYTLRLDIIND